MIDLVFFSTNRTKISHFRYLGRKLGIGIKSFKELNYYASYNEPQLDDRKELLRQSYVSALNQWSRRRKIEDDNSTFFFEDTSVVIHALSEDQEFPGVNVKFWMRKTNFAQLDAQLKARGNDRRATVRSDIVLHLPKRWKEILNVSDDYLWVYDQVDGSIIEEEQSIDLNLVYPWLDDKSFNRWFVPFGAHAPMSALPIEDADKFDFRERAFSKVVDVLARLNVISNYQELRAQQLDLPQFRHVPSVLVICGPSCAGKTTVARWLNEKYKIPHIEASDFMYRAFWDRHGLRSTTKIGDFAESALKTQPDIVTTQVMEYIERKNLLTAVVTGFRSPAEVEIFKRTLNEELKPEIIYLDAEAEVRLARAIARNRDSITAEKFLRRDEQELRMGLEAIRDECADISFDNSGALVDLFKRLRSKYRVFFQMHKLTNSRLRFESNLEPLIIMSLYDFWKEEKWLTTTEITSAINRKFGQKKFKDNVSRYFNQGYHVYYDVRLRSVNGVEKSTVEYKLSTTGLSEAKRLAYLTPTLPVRRLPSSASTQLKLFD